MLLTSACAGGLLRAKFAMLLLIKSLLKLLSIEDWLPTLVMVLMFVILLMLLAVLMFVIVLIILILLAMDGF